MSKLHNMLWYKWIFYNIFVQDIESTGMVIIIINVQGGESRDIFWLF